MFACGQYDFYTKDFIFYRAKLQKPFKKAGQWARNQNTYADGSYYVEKIKP